MKKIENFNISELTENELRSIIGGSFFRDLGRLFGEAWCATKGFAKELASHSDKIVHPGSTFH